MGRRRRAPCCDSSQVKKGAWSDEESEILRDFILRNGHDNWRSLPKLAGLRRCGKSCRLRWINYLRPGLKRGNFTKEEEDTIIQLHQTLGNRWSKIAAHFPGRTDNEIKNVWNTHLKKRLAESNSSSSSSEVINPLASSVSSSSLSSPTSNDVVSNSSEMQTKEVKFEEVLGDIGVGFEENDAPPSLESLFENPLFPPPTSSQPESLAIQIPPPPLPEEWLPIPGESMDHDLWNRMLEPGLDDFNAWLNYLENWDNHT